LQTLRVIDPEPDATGEHGPQCEFDARGPFTFRCPPEIGHLSGLALFCTRPGCTSRLVEFGGKLAAPGAQAPGNDGIPFNLSIEADAGYVLVHEDDDDPGEEHERAEQNAARIERAAQWLGENLSSTILDVFHLRLMEAKGRTLDPAAWKKLDWSWWAPGKVVAWREAEPDGRLDLYVARGHCYSATDYYCANPTCGCSEVQVVFLAPQVERPEQRKLGAVTFSLPDGRQTLISELGLGATEDQLAELGGLFLRRHGSQGLTERHHRIRHEIGIEIYRQHASANQAPPAATGRRRARPNDPCPCGSGKKFKKCCGSAAG
jgi:SEC-C motif